MFLSYFTVNESWSLLPQLGHPAMKYSPEETKLQFKHCFPVNGSEPAFANDEEEASGIPLPRSHPSEVLPRAA